MNKYISSLIGGVIATVILSILMIIKMQMGLLPQFNVIADMTDIAGAQTPIIGWAMHLVLGIIIWGLLFAIVSHLFKGPYSVKGIQFGILLWFLMMIIYMPVTENGFFASHLGYPVMLASLILHIIYGFFLGLFTGLIYKDKSTQ